MPKKTKEGTQARKVEEIIQKKNRETAIYTHRVGEEAKDTQKTLTKKREHN